MGDLFANVADRTIKGLLLPYGEASRTNLTGTEPIAFSKGTVSIPRDVTMVGLNLNHDRFTWAGRVTELEDTDAGMVATFKVAETDEGDEALAAVAAGRLTKLSAEVVKLVRDGAKAISAKLTGAALVDDGAFASAALFALGDVEDIEPTEGAPAASEEPDEPAEEEEEETVPEAQIPTGLPAPKPVAVEKKESTKGEMFAAIESVYRGSASIERLNEVRTFMSSQALFALEDVTYDGVGGIATTTTRPAWIGEVKDGTTYAQKFAPLFGQQTLTALAMAGWKWGTKPAGAAWAGNKAAISSNDPTVTAVTENASRWAGGHDIAREHIDFNTPGFFEAYNAAMRESFDRWLDTTIVLTEALAGATDVEADDPAGLAIGAGWSAVIDGAASIVDAGLTPTSAVVASGLWKAMAKLPQSDVLGYLNAQLSLTGDGRLDTFSIIPAAPTQLTAGHVLVVAKSAADVYTLPGSPIRAEAQNIANGGLDVGFFGYGGFLIKNTAGIVDVGPYTP
jgi:hypothetical protein